MSRHGYVDDDDDPLALGRWRSAVRNAMRGRRGQAFLRELLATLDVMPDKRLVRGQLQVDGMQCRYGDPDLIVGADELVDAHTGFAAPVGAVCALGAVGAARGMDLSAIDPEDSQTVAAKFGIAHAMACEIMYINDDWGRESPEDRFTRVREWVAAQIEKPTT